MAPKDDEPRTRPAAGCAVVDAALDTLRVHLGLEVAYLSELVGDREVIRAVSAPPGEPLLRVGDRHPRSQAYAVHVIGGWLPRLIPDTGALAVARALAVTSAGPIGSHLAVPVRRGDGTAYGLVGAASSRPSPRLGERDLKVAELLAEVVASEVGTTLPEGARHDALLERTRAALAPGGLALHLQPVRDLGTLAPVGMAALARFQGHPPPPADLRFAEAAEVGLGMALESAALACALDLLPELSPPLTLSAAAGPAMVASGGLRRVLMGHDLRRLVIEVTAPADAPEADRLAWELDPLRDRGLQVALTSGRSAGAALSRVLALAPDIIKIDRALVRALGAGTARDGLVEILLAAAARTGANLLALGVETEGELAALRAIGVAKGQGWLLGRPAPAAEALARLASAPPHVEARLA